MFRWEIIFGEIMERIVIKNYKDAYKYLIKTFKQIDFNETVQYLKILNKKKQNNIKISKEHIDNLSLILQTDFLVETKGDLEAFNILHDMYSKWVFNQKIKGGKNKKIHIITDKEKIMDNNIGILKELSEKYITKTKRNTQIRFHLRLLGLVVFHDIVYESGEKHFENFLEGRVSKKERKQLLNKFFKLKYIDKKIVENCKELFIYDKNPKQLLNRFFKLKYIDEQNGKESSDFTIIRNQIAHGKFGSENEEIKIYLNLKENKYLKYSYSQINDFYNIIMVKWIYLRVLNPLNWFIWHLQND